jgi:hypothetical protein
MESQQKEYEVKTYIVGGGLTLREGQIVTEQQLGRYAKWLRSNGAVVELEHQPRKDGAVNRGHTS